MQQPYFASWPPGERSRALALNSIPSSSVFSSVDSEPPRCLGDVDAVLLILTRSSLSAVIHSLTVTLRLVFYSGLELTKP